MFGHSSLPSRIWSFGTRAPIENAELVDDQMRLAHKYRNALCELELKRRAGVDETLRRLSPALIEVEAGIAAAELELTVARATIKRENGKTRKRTRGSTELRTKISSVREKLRACRAERKRLRTELFESPEWKTAQGHLQAGHVAVSKKLRSESGLYWGSYLHIEQSCSSFRRGAPPRFARWTGDGHLALQCQGGLAPADVLAGTSNLLRIEAEPTDDWKQRGKSGRLKGGKKLRRVWFRVGSTGSGGPVWTVVPAVLHRPLPADADIKWAHLIRRKLGTHFVWRLQLVLSRAAGWNQKDRAESGTVGIDVGWRLRPDGSLRVAYWVDERDRHGELVLPADWLTEMRRVETIRSHRDRNFNETLDALVAWISIERETFAAGAPEWLKEAAKTLKQWKAPARLAALTLRWRENRFERDAEPLEMLEAWRKRDRHLYEFEANLRDQLLRRREDLYRCFAAAMRRRYKTVKIEDLDLRDFHALPEAEEAPVDGALKEHVRDAALSVLIRCLAESVTELVKVPAADTTTIHADCGSAQQWDHRELEHKCTACGKRYDQDANAARNLLASGSVTSGTKTAS